MQKSIRTHAKYIRTQCCKHKDTCTEAYGHMQNNIRTSASKHKDTWYWPSKNKSVTGISRLTVSIARSNCSQRSKNNSSSGGMNSLKILTTLFTKLNRFRPSLPSMLILRTARVSGICCLTWPHRWRVACLACLFDRNFDLKKDTWGHMHSNIRTNIFKHKDTCIDAWGHMHCNIRTYEFKHKDTCVYT